MDRSDRFLALDSLRGVCAIAVALFHFNSSGFLSGNALVSHGWLFVDFFFVLSGFVIAAAYRDRIAAGFSAGRFIALRFFRIYPLHLFMLVLFLACELLFLGGIVSSQRTAFGAGRSPGEFIQALLLVNAMGLSSELGWNGPSWSIGGEWWAYLIFAAVAVLARARASIVWSSIIVLAFAVLFSQGSLDRTYDGGVVRCLLGFALGVMTYSLHEQMRFGGNRMVDTGLESVVLLTIILCVVHGGSTLLVFVVPFLFSLAVLVFARSNGAIHIALVNPALVRLGAYSYSIYMVHVFLQARLLDLINLALPDWINRSSSGAAAFAGPPLVGDALTIAMLALLVGVSAATYRLVELPGQAVGRRWLDSRLSQPAVQP